MSSVTVDTVCIEDLFLLCFQMPYAYLVACQTWTVMWQWLAWTPKGTQTIFSLDAPRQKTWSFQSQCSGSLTNPNRQRHFPVLGPLPTSTIVAPPWHHPETGSGKSSHAPLFFISHYYLCLRPCCQATKCFADVLLFSPFLSAPHTHPQNTYSTFIHTQAAQELHHWNALGIFNYSTHHHNASYFLSLIFFPSSHHLRMRLSGLIWFISLHLSVLCFFSQLPFSLLVCTSSHWSVDMAKQPCWLTGLRGVAMGASRQ